VGLGVHGLLAMKPIMASRTSVSVTSPSASLKVVDEEALASRQKQVDR